MALPFMFAVIWLLAAGCQGVSAPTASHEAASVLITEAMTHADVAVRPSEEVRWINNTSNSVQVVFLTPLMGELACNRGFGNFMDPVMSAVLLPGTSASVCVKEPGTLRYAIRLNVGTGSDVRHVAGVVRVGNRGQARTAPESALQVAGPPQE